MHRLQYNTCFFSGAYVPLVPEGKIVVDGVLASCHASADHDVAHLIMVPMQRLSISAAVDIWR